MTGVPAPVPATSHGGFPPMRAHKPFCEAWAVFLFLLLFRNVGECQAREPDLIDPAAGDAGAVELTPLTDEKFCLPGGCSQLAWCENGFVFAAARGRRTIEVMETTTGGLVRVLSVEDGLLRCCAIVGVPPRLFAAGNGPSVVEWDLDTGMEIARHPIPLRGVGHMAKNPVSGDLLLTGGGMGILRVGGKTPSFEALPTQGRVIARSEFSRDGKRLLARDVDGGMRVLEAVAPFRCLWEGPAPGVLYGAGGDLVVRSGDDLQIHRIGAEDRVETLPGLGAHVEGLWIFVGGSRVLARTDDAELVELDLANRSRKPLGFADVVAESLVDGRILTACTHGAVTLREAESGKVLREATVVPGPVTAFPPGTQSGRIVLGTRNGFVVRFDAAATTRETWRTSLLEPRLDTRSRQDGGRIVAVGSPRRKTELPWWTSDSADLVSPRQALGGLPLIAVSSRPADDSTQVLDVSGRIAILRRGDIERFVQIECGHNGPGDGAISTDGMACLAALSNFRTVHLDIATGRQTELSQGFGSSVRALMFSPDETRMGALLWSGEIVLWKHEKRVPQFQSRFSIKGLEAFSFCRCGKHGYGGTRTGFVVVVDLESRRILRRSRQLRCEVGAVGVAPPQDGRDRPCGAILVGLMDGEVFVER
ncbi:MAG: WD40 repeat domain-containing protein [Planctomycetes bacterium]|nr:WD40 repeat domain-containing protein [Planctomycetota bacterium]